MPTRDLCLCSQLTDSQRGDLVSGAQSWFDMAAMADLQNALMLFRGAIFNARI